MEIVNLDEIDAACRRRRSGSAIHRREYFLLLVFVEFMVHREFSNFHAREGAGTAVRVRRRRISSHPEITAASFAFHRSTSGVAAVWAARRFLSGGGWAFVLLALMSFAGGLSLAVFPFNSPDHLITIAGHAPEMLYIKPATSHLDLALAPNPETRPGEETPTAVKNATPAPTDESSASGERRGALDSVVDGGSTELALTASSAAAPLPAPTANFAAAMRLGAVGGGQSHAPGGGLSSGSDAVELPTSVPEPANGAIVALCLAALIAFRRAAGNPHPRSS